MCISRKVRPAATRLFVCVILLFSTFICGQRLSAEMVDKVVAVVNDDIITLSDLEKEGEHTFRRIAASAPPEQLTQHLAAARADILETLIDKHLISQKAAEKKIAVSEAEIDAAFANVLQRSGMTREQLLARLETSGMDEKLYRETLKFQLLQNKLVGTDISSKIVITEDMVLDYYDTHYVSHGPQPKSDDTGGYYLLQIGCSWQNSDKQEALKRIEKAHSMARAGKDFGALARQFSDLPSKVDGGDIGIFELDDMAADMRNAVNGLQAGEISEIIETQTEFQFFKLLTGPGGDRNIVANAPYEQVKDSIKQELFEQEMKKAYGQWVKELKEQAYIQKL